MIKVVLNVNFLLKSCFDRDWYTCELLVTFLFYASINGCNSNSGLKEDFASRKSPYGLQATEHTHHSSGPPSAGSSRSSASSKRKGKKESKFAVSYDYNTL